MKSFSHKIKVSKWFLHIWGPAASAIMEFRASHSLTELCVCFLLLNLPSPCQRFIKKTTGEAHSNATGGASLGQYKIWMVHTQNRTKLSKAPTTWKYAMGGGKPLGTAKGRSDVWPAEMLTPENSPSLATWVPTQFLKCLLVNQNFRSACAVALWSAYSNVSFGFDNRLADASSPENLSVWSDFCWEYGMLLHFVHVPSFYLQGPLHKNQICSVPCLWSNHPHGDGLQHHRDSRHQMHFLRNKNVICI